jgi:hypothetical protein
LQFAYPETEWDLSKFSSRGKKSGQRWLKIKIEELLPGIEIFEDHQHPELLWGEFFSMVFFFSLLLLFLLLLLLLLFLLILLPSLLQSDGVENSNRHMEIDLWIPHYSIGLEYQGMPDFMCEDRQ